jgi:hypothetical protein
VGIKRERGVNGKVGMGRVQRGCTARGRAVCEVEEKSSRQKADRVRKNWPSVHAAGCAAIKAGSGQDGDAGMRHGVQRRMLLCMCSHIRILSYMDADAMQACSPGLAYTVWPSAPGIWYLVSGQPYAIFTFCRKALKSCLTALAGMPPARSRADVEPRLAATARPCLSPRQQ